MHNVPVGWGSVFGKTTHCELDGTGIESGWGGRDFPHTVSYSVGTGSICLGQSGRGVALTTHPYLAPRLKKEYSYIYTPIHGLSRMNFTPDKISEIHREAPDKIPG